MTDEEQNLCNEAERVGRSHGWDHANYEAAYGKTPKGAPGTLGPMAKTMPWRYRNKMYANGKPTGEGTCASAHAYKRGWRKGVAQYKKENPGG